MHVLQSLPMNKYKQSGVNIDAASTFINKIKSHATSTHNKNVLSNIGGFAALYEMPTGYKNPVLVSCTDGVGTKLKIALGMNKHDTIGQDLVAMCVNDLLCCGAEPLFFLDYYATGQLDLQTSEAIIKGITHACETAQLALIGGETAEMPGMYAEKDYDLAGFCVGVVEKNNIIDGSFVKPGDQLIAIGSSGPHSNGYSLIRKILADNKTDFNASFENSTIGETLLTPTRIYVKTILDVLKNQPMHAIAHITGGGLFENLPRVLPDNVKAVVKSWDFPSIFQWLQDKGSVSTQEMLSTFNCGVGMVLVVPDTACLELLAQHGENAWVLGRIENRESTEEQLIIE